MKRFVYTVFCGFILIFLAVSSPAQAVPFRMVGTDVRLFSFGVIADCHYSNRPQDGLREYASSARKLRECVDVFNQRDLRFVLSLGDLTNNDLSGFDTVFSILRGLVHPFRFVYGNHDFIRSEYIDRTIQGNLGLRKRFYSFKQDGYRFIILDSNDISVSSSPEGSVQLQKTLRYIENLKKTVGSNWGVSNGAIGEVQIKWLKKELVDAQKMRERVLICNHMPAYNPNSSYILWNANLFVRVLAQSPQVEAYFCGHIHGGSHFFYNQTHFLNFIAMVDTPENAYSIVHVYSDRMEVEGFGREPGRVLAKSAR